MGWVNLSDDGPRVSPSEECYDFGFLCGFDGDPATDSERASIADIRAYHRGYAEGVAFRACEEANPPRDTSAFNIGDI